MDKFVKYYSWFAVAVVGAAIIAGFFLAGSPSAQRAQRFDEARISNLQYIQSQIVYYWQSKNNLPATLAEMNDPLREVNVPRDPETNTEYVYTARGPLSFSLCAVFGLAGGTQSGIAVPMSAGFANESWQHSAGNYCFNRTIDKDFFKPPKLSQ